MRVSSRLILLLGALTVTALAVGARVCWPVAVAAQTNEPAPAEPSAAEPSAKAPSVPHKPRTKPKPKVKVESAAAPAPASPTPLLPDRVTVSQDLIHAGAGCIGRIEEIAQTSLAGTKAFAAVSGWQPEAPRQHLASVVVGQSYAQSYGLTGIIAAPSTTGGKCEGFTFQVLPSALSCAELQANVLKNGKLEGTLAGIALLRGPLNQVALVPGVGGNGCTLVSFRTEY